MKICTSAVQKMGALSTALGKEAAYGVRHFGALRSYTETQTKNGSETPIKPEVTANAKSTQHVLPG